MGLGARGLFAGALSEDFWWDLKKSFKLYGIFRLILEFETFFKTSL